MEYRNLGKSGLRVSELSYGSWVTFSFQLDKTKAKIKTPPARAKKSATMTLYVPSELSRSDLLGSACKLLKRGGEGFFFYQGWGLHPVKARCCIHVVRCLARNIRCNATSHLTAGAVLSYMSRAKHPM